jgi:sugar phosphate isomerase/epimerase
MLRNSFYTLAGCSLLSFGCNRSEPGRETSAKRTGLRIGVCDWSIRKRGDVDALKVAAGFGFDGVQISMGTAADDMRLRNPELQRAYLDYSQETGVSLASLAIGELNNVPYKSDDRAAQWVLDSIDVCKALGLKVVLLAFFNDGDLKNDEQGTDVVVERLRTAAPLAEKAGVALGIESWLSADEHLDIIDRVGSPALKVYYDLGNSAKMAYDIYAEVERLGRLGLICELHAKDYEGLFGSGVIDFARIRTILDDIGFDGWINAEPVKSPLGFEESMRSDLAHLREVFAS